MKIITWRSSMRGKTEMSMNQKDKDILKANPVLTKLDFAEQLKQWAKKEAKKDMEQSNDNRRDDSLNPR